MEVVGAIVTYLFAVLLGLFFEFYLRWPAWPVLLGSFVLIVLLPPIWAIGIVAGLWISCAFFCAQSLAERGNEWPAHLTFWRLCSSSMLAFGGFLLTLLLIWRLKVMGSAGLADRELIGWSFLVLQEICIFKVMTRVSPLASYRKYLGLGLTTFLFPMIFYTMVEWSLITQILAFVILLNANLFLLTLVDRPLGRKVESNMRK